MYTPTYLSTYLPTYLHTHINTYIHTDIHTEHIQNTYRTHTEQIQIQIQIPRCIFVRPLVGQLGGRVARLGSRQRSEEADSTARVLHLESMDAALLACPAESAQEGRAPGPPPCWDPTGKGKGKGKSLLQQVQELERGARQPRPPVSSRGYDGPPLANSALAGTPAPPAPLAPPAPPAPPAPQSQASIVFVDLSSMRLTTASLGEAPALLMAVMDVFKLPPVQRSLALLDEQCGGLLSAWTPPWVEDGVPNLDHHSLSAAHPSATVGWAMNLDGFVSFLKNASLASKVAKHIIINYKLISCHKQTFVIY